MLGNEVLFVRETFAILIVQIKRDSLCHVYRSSYPCTAKDGIKQPLYLTNIISLKLIFVSRTMERQKKM